MTQENKIKLLFSKGKLITMLGGKSDEKILMCSNDL